MRDGRSVTQTSVTVDRVEALLSSEGHALLDRLDREDFAVIGSLRLSTSLRQQFPPQLVAAALTQHELRSAAQNKFSQAGRMFSPVPAWSKLPPSWCHAIEPAGSLTALCCRPVYRDRR